MRWLDNKKFYVDVESMLVRKVGTKPIIDIQNEISSSIWVRGWYDLGEPAQRKIHLNDPFVH